MKPELVKLDRKTPDDRIVAMLEQLLASAREGKYEVVFVVAIQPDGSWVTIERGKRTDPLRKVGIMESIKADILAASESDEPQRIMTDPLLAERQEAARQLGANRWRAHELLFRHRHPDASAAAHQELVEALHDAEPRRSIEGFRGMAKTTYAEEAVVLKAAFQEFHNLVIVGASLPRAKDRLDAIANEFVVNERLAGVFGPLKGAPWSDERIVLANGVCIQALGRDQSMLGMKYKEWRPDAFLIDDVEDPEEVRSDPQREQTWRWFLRTFLGALDDPDQSWGRFLGTRRGTGSMAERLEGIGVPVSRFPVEYIDKAGERQATWPAKFWLGKIDAIRRMFAGDMDTYAQEYMCEARSTADRTFGVVPVAPRERKWEAVYAFIDPASSVNRGSATTGWAVWSWVGSRLVVWDAGAERLLPDKVVALAFWIMETFDPVWLGVERDGLNQFLMQPLRQEQLRRGLAAVPLKPVSAISGTRGGGKLAFIRGLQPFAAAGEISFARPLKDLQDQLLSFPSGAIDAPNALAYAQTMKPGLLVYEDFTEEHIVDGLQPDSDRHLYLAGNADGSCVCSVLVQRCGGEIRVLADWVCEGSAAELVSIIHAEAALFAETGTVGEVEVTDPDQPYKMPVRRRAWSRHPLRWVVPQIHTSDWHNVGLMQAIRAIPQAVSAAEGGERGRREIMKLLAERHRGRPRLLVSPNARWTLRALTGGYARRVGSGGLAEAEPEKGIYRVLIEGLEAFAGVGSAVEASATQAAQPIAWDKNGRPYASAMPAR